MKINVLNSKGSKVKEIETKIFEGKYREDIIAKIVEAEKIGQEYAPFMNAGMQTSASGNVRHLRHMWKSDRGKGMGRFPKKRMSRRGDRFVWVGAVVPGTRGGRRAHPPKIGGVIPKINKKEMLFGLKSALAMITDLDLVKAKYQSLKDSDIKMTLPLVIEEKVLTLKTREFLDSIKAIVNNAEKIAIKTKKVRAGIGKMRGRKYKKSAGLLLVIGKDEGKKINGIEVIQARELTVSDLASNGARLTMFTEAAINDLDKRLK